VEYYCTCKSQIQQPRNKESETGIKEEKRKKERDKIRKTEMSKKTEKANGGTRTGKNKKGRNE
jgi:hypothetical protein